MTNISARIIEYVIPESFGAQSVGAFLRAQGYSQSIISHLRRTCIHADNAQLAEIPVTRLSQNASKDGWLTEHAQHSSFPQRICSESDIRPRHSAVIAARTFASSAVSATRFGQDSVPLTAQPIPDCTASYANAGASITTFGLSINGARVFTNRILQPGEILHVFLQETAESGAISETRIPLDIVYEDEDIIVVNKPADMPSHPSQGHHERTLGNALAWYAHHVLGQEHFVFRIINRLDRDTTGLLIAAKNMLAAAVLGDAVRKREIHREYRALCTGRLDAPLTIEAPIARKDGSTIERCIDFQNGDAAVTHIEPLIYNEKTDLTLVRLRLETGRTHQIRVHMKFTGHPLPGDFLYNPDYRFIKRQALHSFSLAFRHPVTGAPLYFEAPLPDDMKFSSGGCALCIQGSAD